MGSASSSPRRRVLMIVGMTVEPGRAGDARSGLVPRNDVTEFQRQLGADVIDFGWMHGADRGIPRMLAKAARKSGRWSEVLALRAVGIAKHYDAVYASGEDIGLLFSAVSRLLWWRRYRIVVRLESPRYGRTRVRRAFYERALRFALQRMDIVVCRAEPHARLMRSWAGRARVVVFGQEVDTAYFDDATAPDDDARAVVPAHPFVLSAGLEMRDYGTLLAALQPLPVGVVIGAASPWSKDRFTIAELPAAAVVGRFSPPEMRELYRSAVAVVMATMPTDRTCGMNVVAEAWAMRRPVVAATEGLSEQITEAAGRAVQPGDVEGLRREVADLLTSEPTRRQLGDAGRAYVDAHLSLDAFVAEIERLISSGRT